MKKIAIADDHQMFTDGLLSLLKDEKDIKIVGTASNGTEIIELSNKTSPDIILMDINMPGVDGVTAAKDILNNHPDMAIIMLSMHNREDLVNEVVQMGAKGYILKNTGKSELLEAIDKVFSGGSYYSTEVTETIIQSLKGGKKPAEKEKVKLTTRELEVLHLICEENTTQQIADILFLSPHTIETHRKNLISKLGVKGSTGLVKYALQNGLFKD